MRKHGFFFAGATLASLLIAAAPPSALLQVSGGVWEVSGDPAASSPVRECFLDPMKLAQFEHRRRTCKADLVSVDARSTVVTYQCGAGEFGRSQIDVLTPRSLRISTQGISNQLPFNYVIQAHRIGDCAASSAPRH